MWKFYLIFTWMFLLFQPPVYIPRPVEEWCTCGKCQAWGHPEMNVCCRDHPIWKKVDEDLAQQLDIRCVTETEDVKDLLKPAPLRIQYQNYCCHHGKYM